MTQDPSQPPEDRAPRGARPTPDVTSPTSDGPSHPADGPSRTPGVTHQRLADQWDGDTWRHLLAGAGLGVLTLPAAALVIIGLLVLAVQGAATWLLVSAAALVTAAIGGLGTAVALRGGHRGVVHRLAVLGAVWGVATIVAGVVLALSLDAPERVGVAVVLVLGGTYTLVLALALWGASHVLPAPAPTPVEHDEPAAEPVRAPRTGATPTVSEVPTQAAAPDDDALADWPEWGGDPSRRGATRAPEPAARVDTPHRAVEPDLREPDLHEPDLHDRDAPRTDPLRSDGLRSDAVEPEVAGPARPAPTRPAPARTTPPRSTRATPAAAPRSPSSTGPTATSRPARRSVSSAGTAGPRRTPTSGAATERIARQDGDDGPPTQRIPPVLP